MELSTRSLAGAPLQLRQGTRKEPTSIRYASQLGLLVQKSQIHGLPVQKFQSHGIRCSAAEGEHERAQETSPGAPASWLQPDSVSDPFFGWTSDFSQPKSSYAGWLKIGGGVVLAIGFAFGARTIYARREAIQAFAALRPVTQQIVSSSEVEKVQEASNVKVDPSNDKEGKQAQTERTKPEVQHEETNAPTGLPKMLGRVLVPASVDHMQEQFLAALQALKVIEAGVEPGDICSRREYARWLIAASSILSRSPSHKVYPAMYIENASRLAYVDVLPEDPDFPFIQGLAEAGLITSRLLGDEIHHTQRSMESLDENNGSLFLPDSPLTRQDLISWKVNLERKPAIAAGLSSSTDKEALQKVSGFIDIDKIREDALPALLADVNSGEHSIIALAFGYTRRFQPEKPVTKAQAAIAIATGGALELVSEELARLEAESIAEAAVSAELALETKAQQEVAAAFNELLQAEREKQQAATILVENIQNELEKVKAEREEEKYGLLKERAVLESEKELLSNMRREVEQQALRLSSSKLEVAFEKEQMDKLCTEAEQEREVISKIRAELEIEKNALILARTWAEGEARKALAHSKVLEQVRKRWENQGIKVHVDKELDEVNIPSPSWHYSEVLQSQKSPMDRLVTKSKDLLRAFWDAVMRFFQFIVLICREIKQRSTELIGRLGENLHHARIECADSTTRTVEGIKQTLSSSVTGMSKSIRDGTLKAVDECRGGADRLVQKFKVT